MFQTTLVTTPTIIQNINGSLVEPDDPIFVPDQNDPQPAHLHEGNWLEARFDPTDGIPLVIRRPSTADVRSLARAAVESVWRLTAIKRVRPPSTLIKLRGFSTH
jgi:hypothetical protein